MPNRIVYLNGKFLPLNEAHISVMDRGFLFGDAIYEVIPMFDGRLFRPLEHLQRFKRSIIAISLNLTLQEDKFLEIFEQLIQRNPDQGANRAIYLQVTRGVAENRDHTFSDNMEPTIFAQCTKFTPVNEDVLSIGAKAITVPDIRWAQCYIKAVTLLPNVLLAQQAKKAGAKEAIMIRDGLAKEGTSSNLFIVKNGTLITPPADNSILRGVTHDLILEIAAQQHIPFSEQDIPEQALREADEIWMTGSLKEILPITQLDDSPVGTGKTGPMWYTFFKYYQEYRKI